MDGTNFTKTEGALDINNTLKKNVTIPDKEEKRKQHNVTFVPFTQKPEDVFIECVAFDENGNRIEEDEITKQLSDEGKRLFVFDRYGNLPYAYENKGGKILVSSEPISATSQLPGSKFTPKKSALAEDITAQGSAYDYTVAEDAYGDTQNTIDNIKAVNAKYDSEIKKIQKELTGLKDFENDLKTLPKEPVKPDPDKLPPKPEYEAKVLKVPQKPETPVAPTAPKKPAKPVPPTPPFEMKELKHFRLPEKPEKSDYVEEIGEPPKYSKVGQFFSRLFLRKDSDDYKEYLKYKAKLISNEEGIKKYESDMKGYKKRLAKYNAREQEIKNYNKKLEENKEQIDLYKKQMDEYTLAAVKYNDELKQYNNDYADYKNKAIDFKEELDRYQSTAFVNYMKEMEEYQKAAEEESKRARNYDVQLQFYNSAQNRFAKDTEEYEKKKPEYDKALSDLEKKYGMTKEQGEKKMSELKARLEGLKKDKELANKKAERAQDELDSKKQEYNEKINEHTKNRATIEEYRTHTEVRMEGIASLIKNGAITRDNLFANTWLLKSACNGKSTKDPEALDAFYKYLASRKAENEIVSNTRNYKVANPEAEAAVIRNLNSNQTVNEMKTDPVVQKIISMWDKKPMNPEMMAADYFIPGNKKKIQSAIARDEMKNLKKEMENDFGIRPVDENEFESFVRYAVINKAIMNTRNSMISPNSVMVLEEELYASDGNPTKNVFAQMMNDTRNTYEVAFNEFIKNQRAKEESVKDLTQNQKTMFQIKTDYTLPDFEKAVKDTHNRLLQEGRINEKGKLLAPKENKNIIKDEPGKKESEIKPKPMGI